MKTKIILLVILCLSFSVFADNIRVSKSVEKVGGVDKDVFTIDDTKKIQISKDSNFVTQYQEYKDKLKLSQLYQSAPKGDLVYSFPYTGKIQTNLEWVSFSDLEKNNHEWKKNGDTFVIVNQFVPWVMFDNGYVFDYSDIIRNNPEVTLKEIAIDKEKVVVTFSINKTKIKSYPYLIDPTYGNGTIQNCVGNSTDICNITVSSTISGGTDFVYNATKSYIDNGVTIRVVDARLTMNMTSGIYFVGSGNINGNGSTFSNDGGSGGSCTKDSSSSDGATNGNSGTCDVGCAFMSYGCAGSGLLPFYNTPGAAGSSAGLPLGGGGFYATGATTSDPGGGAAAGGSGAAIRLIAPTISNVNISSAGGTAVTHTTPGNNGAGGSGGGEISLLGAKITTAQAVLEGSDAIQDGKTADGGSGGVYFVCYTDSYSNTSVIDVSAGSGTSAGSVGIVNITSSATCEALGGFTDVLTVDVTTANATVFSSPNPTMNVTLNFSVGITEDTNVTCWQNLSGVTSEIGQYNSTLALEDYNITNLVTAGSHTFSITCGNDSAGLTNVTSNEITFIANDTTSLSGCTAINVPSTLYHLSSNITAVGSCFDINAVDSVFDCNGYTIKGDGTGVGVNIITTNFTLENCNIQGFEQAIKIEAGTANLITIQLYNNSYDLNSSSSSYNATKLILSNTSGYSDYTNLTIEDIMGGMYYIKWVIVPAIPTTPYHYTSFNNKAIEIESQSATSINSITWQWLASEAVGYNESSLQLWGLSGSTWSLINDTPDTTNHQFVITNLVPATTYVILSPTGPGVAIISPPDGSSLPTNNISLVYNVTTDRALICNTTLDLSITPLNSTALPVSALVTIPVSPSSGAHTWQVQCYDPLNVSFTNTVSASFTIGTVINATSTITLLNTTFPVLTTTAISYNSSGILRVLYFINTTPSNTFFYQELLNNLIVRTENVSMNETKPFFLFLQYPTKTVLESFNTGVRHVTEIASTFTVSNAATGYDVSSNAYYDAGQYAYTQHLSSISFATNSFYLYWLPTTTGSVLTKQVLTSTTPSYLSTASHNRNIQWQSAANSSTISDWWYAAPLACDATTDSIAIYHYDGTSSTLVRNLSACYNQADLQGSKVIFEGYGSKMYVIIANVTNATIYSIQDNSTYAFNNTIQKPSTFLFNDEYTFDFFSTESGVNYAYSCYFENTTKCDKITLAQYGQKNSYGRSSMETSKKNNTIDTLANGAIYFNGGVVMSLVKDDFDLKFICYDEQQDYRKEFISQIFSDNASIVLSNYVWGYSIPSSSLGPTQRRAYLLCTPPGTTRMYFAGLNTSPINLNAYSLNSSVGEYCTFHVNNQYGQPLENVHISGYRFSNLKQASVVIEQALTDVTGTGILFLQPLQIYTTVIELNGSATLNFQFIPPVGTATSPCTITVQLSPANQTPVKIPNFDYVFNDISYTITPGSDYYTTNQNLTFQISSSAGQISQFGFNITKKEFGNTTLVYNVTVNGSPSGGIVNYTTNGNGTYTIIPWFIINNASINFQNSYLPLPKQVVIGPLQGLSQAIQKLQSSHPISGWSWFFIALVFAMIAGGFVSQYSLDGAGAVALLILWGFAFMYPFEPILCFNPVSCSNSMTAIGATVLTTIMVMGSYVLKNYI